MKIIIGLGNIGQKYQNNRHNIGFMAVDQLAHDLEKKGSEISWQDQDSKFQALTAKLKYKNEDILLVKPTTLMNRSGVAVKKITDFYKEPPENLITVYDDIDLPLGKIRVRKKGSAGTHNGMKSIIFELNSENFPRVRIGIESRGEHAPKLQDLSSFVLSDFNSMEEEEKKNAIKEASKELQKFLE